MTELSKAIIGGKTYELPEGLIFRVIETNGKPVAAAIMVHNPLSPLYNGQSMLNSVDLKGDRSSSKKQEAVEKMVKRYGGELVEPAPSTI